MKKVKEENYLIKESDEQKEKEEKKIRKNN